MDIVSRAVADRGMALRSTILPRVKKRNRRELYKAERGDQGDQPQQSLQAGVAQQSFMAVAARLCGVDAVLRLRIGTDCKAERRAEHV